MKLKIIVLSLMAIFHLGLSKAQEYSNYFTEGMNAAAEGRYSEALSLYEKGAISGDKYCCGRVAACYLYGLGCNTDIFLARKWAQKGYELGNSFSAVTLGYTYLYEYGIDSEIGTIKATPYLIYAYNADDSEKDNAELYANIGATIVVAKIYNGEEDEAKKWMERVVTDYPTYTPTLGSLSYLCWGFGDYEKAVKYATEADKDNNLQASFVLGWCMLHGKGIIQNEEAGFKKIQKVALIGSVDYAMFALGECYYNGKGTSVDKEQAKEWFQKAADAGNEEAQEKLNLLFK